jgi:predicted esterase
MDFWRLAASVGWLVAVPQSSQALWKGAYVWDDYQTTEKEILQHYENINNQYAVNPDQVILAGHSMGGEIAIRLTLKQTIRASGFVAFGPGGPFIENLEEWQTLLEQNHVEGLKGYIIFGDQDNTIPQKNIQSLGNMLNEAGLDCMMEQVPLAGHDFVPEYAQALLRALEFFALD